MGSEAICLQGSSTKPQASYTTKQERRFETTLLRGGYEPKEERVHGCNGKIQRSGSSAIFLSQTPIQIVQGLFPQKSTSDNSLQKPLDTVVMSTETTKEVLEICNRLGDNKAASLGDIPNKVFKVAVEAGHTCGVVSSMFGG